MTQRYRNMRRNSEPCGEHASSSTKRPKFDPELEVTPVALSSKRGDEVAYRRNMERLCKELKMKQPNQSIIQQLIDLTYHRRRENIQHNESTSIFQLLDEYPFLKIHRWAST